MLIMIDVVVAVSYRRLSFLLIQMLQHIC